MLNGAVTLGTLDGANVEIVREAGMENNYIFGGTVEDFQSLGSSYNPVNIYNNNMRIKKVVDTLIDGTFSDGKTGIFKELYDSILEGASWHAPDVYNCYMILNPIVIQRSLPSTAQLKRGSLLKVLC